MADKWLDEPVERGRPVTAAFTPTARKMIDERVAELGDKSIRIYLERLVRKDHARTRHSSSK